MLTVTDNAASQLKEIMKGEEFAGAAVRVFVRHQCGCGAINHGMGFDGSVGAEDEVFDHSGIKFVADRDTASTLDGAVLDYLETAMNRGFSISNPNAQGCGCGGHQ